MPSFRTLKGNKIGPLGEDDAMQAAIRRVKSVDEGAAPRARAPEMPADDDFDLPGQAVPRPPLELGDDLRASQARRFSGEGSGARGRVPAATAAIVDEILLEVTEIAARSDRVMTLAMELRQSVQLDADRTARVDQLVKIVEELRPRMATPSAPAPEQPTPVPEAAPVADNP